MSNACSISKRKLLAIVAAIIVALAACLYASMTMKADIASASEIAIGETTFAANALEYDGTEKAAISKTGDANAQYRLDYESDSNGAVWKTEIPTVKSIGVHTVQIKVGDQIEELKVEVVDAEPSSDANGILPISSESGAPYIVPAYKEYTGEKIELISNVGEVNGTEGFTAINYSLNGQDWSTEIPTGIEPGSHTVYIRVLKDSNNFYGFEVRACITKKAASLAFNNYTNGEKTSMDYVEGSTYDFSANNIDAKYNISDTNIATIDGSGTVKINNPGAATITASVPETELYKPAKISHTLVVQATDTLELKDGDAVIEGENPVIDDYVLNTEDVEVSSVVGSKIYGDADSGAVTYSTAQTLSEYGLKINEENGQISVTEYDTLAAKLVEGNLTINVTVTKADGYVEDYGDYVIYPGVSKSYSVTIKLAEVKDSSYTFEKPVSVNPAVEDGRNITKADMMNKDYTKYYAGNGLKVSKADADSSVEVGKTIAGLSENITFGLDSEKTEKTYETTGFYVKDNGGYVGYIEFKNIIVDDIAPEISSVVYHEVDDVNDKGTSNDKYIYFNDPAISLEITETNFDPSKVKVVIKDEDGKEVKSVIGNKLAWNNSGKKHTAIYDPELGTDDGNADGKYSVTISCSDRCGNALDANYESDKTLVVDNIAPVIEISYDKAQREKNKISYYGKSSFKGYITVTEENFDENDFKLVGNKGQAITDWSSEGNKHTASFTINGDGNYVITASYTDKSNNDAKPHTSNQKTIDTKITEPTIRINGADGDGRAYKNQVVPSISFEDPNYESYKITLLRTRYDVREANVTSSFMRGVAVTSTGGSGSFDTFDRIRENDGIYKLTVEFSDILGHTSKKEITFTVNRFGSVYEFGEYLTEIIQNGGEYIKACEENLTITEYNPDRIVDGSLNIEITRDGKPLEDAEFRTTSTLSGAAGVGWYQYEYVIDKSNFKQDGLYKIDISSADATGNTPENNNFEDKKISFKVDATAPEITSIKGLEEPRIKANKQDVDFDVYDTIGLKSVEVYVDGKLEGKTITDFSADLNNYSGSFTLNESNKSQEVRIKVTDLAGNVTDTADNDFTSAYAFEDKVTVSTNIIALWFANKPLFFGTIAGVLIIVAAIWYALNGRRRHEEEEEF